MENEYSYIKKEENKEGKMEKEKNIFKFLNMVINFIKFFAPMLFILVLINLHSFIRNIFLGENLNQTDITFIIAEGLLCMAFFYSDKKNN